MHPHRLPFIIFSTVVSSLMLLSTFQNVEGQQTNRLVETIEVMGNRRFSDKDILKHIKTLPGQPYSEKQMQLDLQAILALGVFNKIQSRVSVEEGVRGGVIVIFEVVEMPIIKDVKFEGLRNIQEVEIVAVLRQKKINIGKGAVFDPVQIRKATQIISKFLTSRYWSNVTVTTREDMRTSTEVSLTLIIEGDDYSFIETAHNQPLR